MQIQKWKEKVLHSKLTYLTSDRDDIIYGNSYITIIIKKSDWINKKVDDIDITILEKFPNTSHFGSLNNEYKKLIDFVMMLPADKLKELKEKFKQ